MKENTSSDAAMYKVHEYGNSVHIYEQTIALTGIQLPQLPDPLIVHQYPQYEHRPMTELDEALADSQQGLIDGKGWQFHMPLYLMKISKELNNLTRIATTNEHETQHYAFAQDLELARSYLNRPLKEEIIKGYMLFADRILKINYKDPDSRLLLEVEQYEKYLQDFLQAAKKASRF